MSKSKLAEILAFLEERTPFDVIKTLHQIDEARTDKPTCVPQVNAKRGKRK